MGKFNYQKRKQYVCSRCSHLKKYNKILIWLKPFILYTLAEDVPYANMKFGGLPKKWFIKMRL